VCCCCKMAEVGVAGLQRLLSAHLAQAIESFVHNGG